MIATVGPIAHELLAARILHPLHEVWRFTRPAWRNAVVTYWDGLRFRAQASTWDEGRKRAWVLAALRAAARRAAVTTPYYRDLFARIGFDARADFDYEDFAKLPILERDDVRRAGHDLVSTAVDPAALRKDATGGSTGVPTEVWSGPEDRGWGESGIEYYMKRLGLPRGTRVALLWGHHLDPKAAEGLGDRVRAFVSNVRWFDCFRLSPAVLARYHHEMEQYRPTFILAYAGALAALATEIAERGWTPSYPERCAITGAEKLLPRDREVVRAVLNKPVHERYGSRDVGLMAFQLEPERTLDFEVDWPNVLLEPETTDPMSPILVTKLHADGMSMLRYRVGDVARFPAGSRPGAPTFVLHEVLGREVDRIRLSSGRWVYSLQFPHMLKDYPVREYQVVQRSDASVVVRLVPSVGFDTAARTAILRAVRANLTGLDVRLELVDEIPRTRANKRRPVINELEAAAREVSG